MNPEIKISEFTSVFLLQLREKPSEAIGKTVGFSYEPPGGTKKAPGKGGHHLAPFYPSTTLVDQVKRAQITPRKLDA